MKRVEVGIGRDVLRVLSEGTAAAIGDAFFRSLARSAARALNAKYSFVGETLSDTESHSLAFWEGADFGDHFSYRLPGSPCQRVTQGHVCCTPTGVRELFPQDRWLVDIGVDSYVGVPMVTESNRVIGHLAVLDIKPMDLSEDDLAVLAIFAARGCAELERRQAEQRERALLEINNAVISNLTPETMLQALGDPLKRIVRFDRAALTIYERDKDALRLRGLYGKTGDSRFATGQVLDRKDSHIGWVHDQRKTLLRRDLTREREFGTEHALFGEGVRSMCTTPLLVAGESVGTLTVGSLLPFQYSPSDANFLEAVSGQVALAVSNILAFEQITALKARLHEENVYLQEEIRAVHNFDEIVGLHPSLLSLLERIRQVAPTDSAILITGETGTGKELVARAIHGRSGRRDRPLVKVNCGAISAGLVESELFGHIKGAFTGALTRRVGRFEVADGGTLFLDEVGELPVDTQVKLLRVLQEQEFEPVGSNDTRRVDVRVIAATNRDLLKSVQEGRFRADLFYRLNVIPLHVPPLRERRQDIPQLASYFLDRNARRSGKKMGGIAPDSLRRLVEYSWPGNIRELQNVIERAVVLSSGPELRLESDLLATAPPPVPANGADANTPNTAAAHDAVASLEEMERRHILAMLERTGGVIEGPQGAAMLLNMKASTLRSRMKKLRISRTGT